jgi:hypothetical protein
MHANYHLTIAVLVFAVAAPIANGQLPGDSGPAGFAEELQDSGGVSWMGGLFHAVTGIPRPEDRTASAAGYAVDFASLDVANFEAQPPLQKDDLPLAGEYYEPPCDPPWIHRSGVFGEFLYLRSRDGEVAYAVPVDGAIVPPPRPFKPARSLWSIRIIRPAFASARRAPSTIAPASSSPTRGFRAAHSTT